MEAIKKESRDRISVVVATIQYSCMEFLKEDILKSSKGKESPKWCDEEIESVIGGVKEHALLWNHPEEIPIRNFVL